MSEELFKKLNKKNKKYFGTQGKLHQMDEPQKVQIESRYAEKANIMGLMGA